MSARRVCENLSNLNEFCCILAKAVYFAAKLFGSVRRLKIDVVEVAVVFGDVRDDHRQFCYAITPEADR